MALSRSSSALVVPTSSHSSRQAASIGVSPSSMPPCGICQASGCLARRPTKIAPVGRDQHQADIAAVEFGARRPSWPELRRLGAQPRHAGVAAFEVADDRHQRHGGPFGPAPGPGDDGVDRLVVGLHDAEAMARRLLGRASRSPRRPAGRGCRRRRRRPACSRARRRCARSPRPARRSAAGRRGGGRRRVDLDHGKAAVGDLLAPAAAGPTPTATTGPAGGDHEADIALAAGHRGAQARARSPRDRACVSIGRMPRSAGPLGSSTGSMR